jgi:hypothetical protein
METIKASELYIDKYYYQVVEEYEPCTPKIIKWSEVNWYRIGECIEFIEWFEPIPLTEEWLLKFGFKKSSWGWIKNGVNIQKGFTLAFSSNKNSIEIKHLHQLQNLYFALTGQELEFKQ